MRGYNAGYYAGYKAGFDRGRQTLKDAGETPVISAGDPDLPHALPGARIYTAHKFGVTSRRITRVERTDRTDWCYWTGEYYMYTQATYGSTWFLSIEEAMERFKALKAQWQSRQRREAAEKGK